MGKQELVRSDQFKNQNFHIFAYTHEKSDMSLKNISWITNTTSAKWELIYASRGK